jgi:hypothetical protein
MVWIMLSVGFHTCPVSETLCFESYGECAEVDARSVVWFEDGSGIVSGTYVVIEDVKYFESVEVIHDR